MAVQCDPARRSADLLAQRTTYLVGKLDDKVPVGITASALLRAKQDRKQMYQILFVEGVKLGRLKKRRVLRVAMAEDS